MFTEKEIEYLTGQRLGPLATVTPAGRTLARRALMDEEVT